MGADFSIVAGRGLQRCMVRMPCWILIRVIDVRICSTPRFDSGCDRIAALKVTILLVAGNDLDFWGERSGQTACAVG